jgi:hydroxymethylpyrimidine pyrophosphatase-like HAD family hydrolase
VTGRELPSLFNTFDHVSVFDHVVAENGAVLYDSATESVHVLAAAPPPALIAALQEAEVPVSVGHSIVATSTPHEHQMLEIIHSLGLEWHLIFNKRAVMALPAGVTKATGLAAALERLNHTPEATVGIGDAENDQTFLQLCGLSVAVANALPAVKDVADVVLTSARGAGVIELIDKLRGGELEAIDLNADRDVGRTAARRT